MGALRISELAERTGFTPSTLRFYEQAGLLPEPPRTSAGYRTYGEDAVDRLLMIAWIKQLGLTLEDIRELASAREVSCAHARRRLDHLLAAKIGEVDRQVDELGGLRSELVAARAGLGVHVADIPCDGGCCLGAPDARAGRLRAARPAIRTGRGS